jgi:hypothetical protein
VRPAEVRVVVVGAEGGDLEGLAVASDCDRSELVLVDRARKELDDALRTCVRGEVPVGRPPAEDDVPQRPADDICRLTVRPEPFEQGADGSWDRALDGLRPADRGRQLRPRKRYDRQASLRSSPRYGVNSE